MKRGRAKTGSSACQVPGQVAGFALVLLGACATRHVTDPIELPDESMPSTSGPDASVAVVSVIDASVPTESSVVDRGSGFDPFGPYDRSTPERPSPKDSGIVVSADDVTNGLDAPSDSPADHVDIVPEMDSGPQTTQSILAAQSPDCLACAVDNGCLDPMQLGATCEMVTGQARSGGLSETAMCLEVLKKIISSRCSLGPPGHETDFTMTPCECGTTDNAQCLAGTAVPNGPLYDDYVDDFGNSASAITANFTTLTFGAAVANATIICVEAYASGDPRCFSCVGLSSDAGVSQ